MSRRSRLLLVALGVIPVGPAACSSGEIRGESGSLGVSSDSAGTADETGTNTDGDADATASNGDGDGDGDGDGEKLDVTGDGDGDCEGEEAGHPFIWIPNSTEGTVSKLDTQTGLELGRYLVREDGLGSPSAVAVNRRGDVAVANREGGVAVIVAHEEDCADTNGVPGIQTSTGPLDLLPFGEDDCLGWFTEFDVPDNKPVAWTIGEFDEETCTYSGLDVWTATSNLALGSARAILLDGTTGEIVQEVPIPGLPEAQAGAFGFYGAAADAEDNLWLTQLSGGWLVRVNRSDFSHDHWQVPGEGGYGMTITAEGYVWLCGRSTHRFDPIRQSWETAPLFDANYEVHTGGCMGDGDGILYRGSYAEVQGLDTETLEVVRTLDPGSPGDDHMWGVAVDFDGFVWAVPRSGDRAHKIDPESNTKALTATGLVASYPYGDLTGFALSTVASGG